eukprot:scaffold8469_cov75-Phaeocystis_antarctica.AAC.2
MQSVPRNGAPLPLESNVRANHTPKLRAPRSKKSCRPGPRASRMGDPEGLLALYRSSPELMATRGVMRVVGC